MSLEDQAAFEIATYPQVQTLAILERHLLLFLAQDDLLVSRVVEIALVGFDGVGHALEKPDIKNHITMLAQHDFQLGLIDVATDLFTRKVDAHLLSICRQGLRGRRMLVCLCRLEDG